ncbi:MAG: hypothetical protein PVH61_13370 [Candidatus Aminicenantes bacterium]
MNRKILTILIITGFLLSLAAACGKLDKAKKSYIACSREIIEYSRTLDPKSGSYSEQLKRKVLEIGKKHNFQGIAQLKTAYKKYIKDSDPRLLEILQKTENVQPGKVAREIPSDKVPVIERVLEEQDKRKAEDEKSFLIGCERGDTGRVLYFLDKGVDINVRDEKTGKTGLHYAVEGFYTEIVLLLLKKGANPNIRSLDGLPPILLPGKIPVLKSRDVLKHTEIMDLLLNAGGNVNDQTEAEGLNVLGMYFLNSPGSDTLRIAKYLLEKGADINARTTNDMEWENKFIPAGSTLLDIMTAIDYSHPGALYFLKKQGSKHGTWAKYYLEGVDKKDLIDSIESKEKPVKKPVEPVAAKEKPKSESGKAEKSPSELVIAAYMAANKGEYSETLEYIHTEVSFAIMSSGGMHKLKELWDKATRNGNIKRIEILSQEIRGEGAEVFFKILFKDGQKKVIKEKLLKDYGDGGWKLAGAD